MNLIRSDNAMADLPDSLAEAEYVRQRIAPQPRDVFYLPLSDLRSFLDCCSQQSFDTVLDYGCGGSPYRGLFQEGSKYIRADYVDSPGIDFRIKDSGVLPLSDESCDCILSTQVLEHVLSPRIYLSEAFRVLRPGGTMILTTNGIWEDHGCPYDFWRWTADGLRRDVITAGFDVKQAKKLTTGPRAVLFLLGCIPHQLNDSRRTMHGLGLRLLNRLVFTNLAAVKRWADRRYAANRTVDDREQGHGLYIGLGMVAIKPTRARATSDS
jgi:SAM-dependent methyltransferase